MQTWEEVAGLQLPSEGSPGASFLPVLPPLGVPRGLPGGGAAPGLYRRKHTGEARFGRVTQIVNSGSWDLSPALSTPILFR